MVDKQSGIYSSSKKMCARLFSSRNGSIIQRNMANGALNGVGGAFFEARLTVSRQINGLLAILAVLSFRLKIHFSRYVRLQLARLFLHTFDGSQIAESDKQMTQRNSSRAHTHIYYDYCTTASRALLCMGRPEKHVK